VLSDPRVTESVENRSLALADMISFAEGRVLLTLGVRQQWLETQSRDATTGAETGAYDENALTPSIGLVYRPVDSISLYANYAESLQPGAIAPSSSGGVPVLNAGEVLNPFRGEQMEIGAKYDSGSFGGTLSLFTLSRPTAIVENRVFGDDGEERSRGVELSLFGEPVAGVRILGGLTWLDAELVDTAAGANDGNRPIGVPELQVNLNGEWDPSLLPGVTLEARVLHTFEQELDAANTASIDSWTRLDVGGRWRLGVGGRDVTARLRVENLLDEDYWASTGGFPGSNYLVQGAPRTLSLTASIEL
jgi:iron complex outermembrane receptor protein